MYFFIFVEDKSGETAISHLLKKIFRTTASDSYKIHSYHGIGNLPKNCKSPSEIKQKQLLSDLPRLLKGFSKSFKTASDMVMIAVCDLDNRNKTEFRKELEDIRNGQKPIPNAHFCFAVEEMESWLLGDKEAVRNAYPSANKRLLDTYEYDSVCGTWELLANIIYPGGAERLKSGGHRQIGAAKIEWADNIAPLIHVDENKSPSFQKFRDLLRDLEKET